jgi:hypothetical protein
LAPLLGVDLSGIASGGGAALKYFPMAWLNTFLDGGVGSHRDARKQPSQWHALIAQFRKSYRS